MSQLIAANNAQTNITSAITATATSVTVTSGTGAIFPAPTASQYFVATFTDAATGLLHEIVWVTNVTGDTMTIVRGQEGTTALPWNSGDIFANLMTAGQLELMTQPYSLQLQSGNYAADSGTANAMVVTLSPIPASQSALVGVPIRVKKIASANTGATTLNVNSFGVVSVVNPDGTALASGQLPSGCIFEVIYDGTNYQLQTITTAPTTSPVTSVFGRTGAVVAASGDYTIGEISGAGALASLNVGTGLTSSGGDLNWVDPYSAGFMGYVHWTYSGGVVTIVRSVNTTSFTRSSTGTYFLTPAGAQAGMLMSGNPIGTPSVRGVTFTPASALTGGTATTVYCDTGGGLYDPPEGVLFWFY